MLYPILKIIMKTAVRIFFKEIRISGLENIPKNKPIIIAANHNSAFMDAIVTAVFIEPQIYFLTRSDVFNTPLKKWILKKMNLIPIYRLQEGAGNLHKNEQTFEDCYKLLAKNKSILIFSEGICIQEKRLHKLKKGTARIAFGAELFNDLKLDLQVLPLGINYTKPSQFRSKLFLKFAPPISIRSYFEILKIDENKAFTAFTRDLEKVMAEQIVNLKHKDSDCFYDQLVEVYFNDLFKSLQIEPGNEQLYFKLLRDLGEVVNEMYLNNKEQFDAINATLKNYLLLVEAMSLKDKTVLQAVPTYLSLTAKIVFSLFLFPLHLISLLFNYAPYRISYLIAIKTCKHIEFVSSVIIGTAAFLFLLLFLLSGIIISAYMPTLYLKVLAFALMPTLALFSLHFNSFLKQLRLQILAKRKMPQLLKLKTERSAIIEQLNLTFLSKLKSRSN